MLFDQSVSSIVFEFRNMTERMYGRYPVADKILGLSVVAKAVTYAGNQWNAFRRYTTDGRLTIDNNTSKRMLHHQAIGHKNWLFVGSDNAGPLSCTRS